MAGALNCRGQISTELLVVATVLAALLLIVVVTTYNTNMETGRLLSESQNSIQCNEISSVIARAYSNRATTKETVFLAENAKLERISGKPGGITVGTITCEYVGTIENSAGTKDIYSGGISLAKGNWCFSKSDGVIVLNEGGCT